MFPYLIAGAIGFVVAKIFEEDETPKYADGGSVLLAPNGKPSNLTPEQYKLVRTTKFKNWFGDWENDPATASKVVDENGEPLVVYHGTNNDFTIFDEYKIGNRTRHKVLRNGMYFSSKIYSAKTFGGKIYEVFLNLKNPHIIDLVNGKNVANAERELRDVEWEKVRFQNKYTRGFIIKNTNDTLRSDDDFEIIDIFIVNNPSEIKLADGTNTTFDGENPDIRYAGGGEVSKNVDSKLKELDFVFNNSNYRYGKKIDEQDYITAFYDKRKGLYKIRGTHKFKTPLGENSVGIQYDFDNEKEFYNKINEYLLRIN